MGNHNNHNNAGGPDFQPTHRSTHPQTTQPHTSQCLWLAAMGFPFSYIHDLNYPIFEYFPDKPHRSRWFCVSRVVGIIHRKTMFDIMFSIQTNSAPPPWSYMVERDNRGGRRNICSREWLFTCSYNYDYFGSCNKASHTHTGLCHGSIKASKSAFKYK